MRPPLSLFGPNRGPTGPRNGVAQSLNYLTVRQDRRKQGWESDTYRKALTFSTGVPHSGHRSADPRRSYPHTGHRPARRWRLCRTIRTSPGRRAAGPTINNRAKPYNGAVTCRCENKPVRMLSSECQNPKPRRFHRRGVGGVVNSAAADWHWSRWPCQCATWRT